MENLSCVSRKICVLLLLFSLIAFFTDIEIRYIGVL